MHFKLCYNNIMLMYVFYNHEDKNADNMKNCHAVPVTVESDAEEEFDDTEFAGFTPCRTVVDGNSNDMSESLLGEMIDEQDLDSGKIYVLLFRY